MVVIRGTNKFLDRVGRPQSETPPSTSVLGDWYANVLFWRPQAALFVNERSLLPIVMPLAPAATVITRLPPTVELVLGLHGLAGSFIAHELDAMESAVLGKTANRSVVGHAQRVRAPRCDVASLGRQPPRSVPSPGQRALWPAVQDPHRPASRRCCRRRRVDPRAPLIPASSDVLRPTFTAQPPSVPDAPSVAVACFQT